MAIDTVERKAGDVPITTVEAVDGDPPGYVQVTPVGPAGYPMVLLAAFESRANPRVFDMATVLVRLDELEEALRRVRAYYTP